MRQAYVHEATLVMEPGSDERAPGAAVTTALCGHWDHDPPCAFAPHFTTAERSDRAGDQVRLRVLFATQPQDEAEVRRRIDLALGGEWDLPEGFSTPWRLTRSQAGKLSAHEADHAERLTHG